MLRLILSVFRLAAMARPLEPDGRSRPMCRLLRAALLLASAPAFAAAPEDPAAPSVTAERPSLSFGLEIDPPGLLPARLLGARRGQAGGVAPLGVRPGAVHARDAGLHARVEHGGRTGEARRAAGRRQGGGAPAAQPASGAAHRLRDLVL